MSFKADSKHVHALHPSCNCGDRAKGFRADMIVLHYTGMEAADQAVRWLADPRSKVSSHYVVDEKGHITQLVEECQRAWHAGASHWAGETDINSCSIGIEIANPGHDQGYPDFPKRQVAAVTALCRSIFTRHKIPADRVLGHSDVAPARKQDPGEKFPWRLLANSGIGMWVKPTPVTEGNRIYVLGETDPTIERAQRLLARYGYGVNPTGAMDATTRDTLAAFQRHFRPARVDGVLDLSTITTLTALVEARDARLNTLQPG